MCFTNPTINSYKRVGIAGFEAPDSLCVRQRDRTSAFRIPAVRYETSKRIEFRIPDPSASGYLSIAAVLMAGLDGIIHKYQDGDANKLSTSLGESLDGLEEDSSFLSPVFSNEFIKDYINYKRIEIQEF